MARLKPQLLNHTSTRFPNNLHHITSSSSSLFNAFYLHGDYQLKRMPPAKRTELQGGQQLLSLRTNTVSSGQDPLQVLVWHLMLKILGNLVACTVAISLTVSRAWNGIASSDRLWTSMVRGIPKLAAYTISVMDGKRKRIMRDDLCDHAWEFHFTEVVYKVCHLMLV